MPDFLTFPTSSMPHHRACPDCGDPVFRCPKCQTWSHFYWIGVRVEYTSFREFDVYTPGCPPCKGTVLLEIPRQISFFGNWDYAVSPWDTALQNFNVSRGPDGYYITPRPDEGSDEEQGPDPDDKLRGLLGDVEIKF